MLSDDIVGGLDVGDKNMPVPDFDSELPLDGFVDVDAGFDVDEASLVAPVSVEGDGHALRRERGTFQRSGSIWLSLLWTHLMILLAVRPG